jgi:hypothetical protein
MPTLRQSNLAHTRALQAAKLTSGMYLRENTGELVAHLVTVRNAIAPSVRIQVFFHIVSS